MKKFVFGTCLLFTGSLFAQNIGINTTGATPDASAMLDVVSSDKGVLIPRVALTATNNAAPTTTPTTSLLVYNTATAGAGTTAVTPGYYYWDGSEWLRIFNSGDPTDDWKLEGNSGTVAGTDFIGTKDAIDLVFKTNNTEYVRILSTGNVGIGTNAPANKLQVVGTSGDENTGVVRLGSAASNLRFGVVDGSRTWIQSHSSLPLYINNLGNNTIINPTDGANNNVGVGVTAPTAKLEVDFNSNNDFAAVKAIGQFGTTNGYLGVQGKTDYDGVTTADWNGQEIGVVGISVGTSSTDNFGVKGHSNYVGVRGEHSTAGTFAELGTPTHSIEANGDAEISNGWLSVGGTTTSIRKYAKQTLTWDAGATAADGSITRTVGTFTVPANIPAGTTIRVDKIKWNVDSFHEDANEQKTFYVRIGTSAWYGYAGNTADGAADVNWQYINDFGTGGPTFTGNQTVQLYASDEGCCWSDYYYLYNVEVEITYSYAVALQDGDISASGRIYANSNVDVGDLAEYFELKEDANFGDIVTLIPGSNNEYELSNTPYAQNIVGVVSENPSVVLNNPNVGPAVALAGRVKVKVVESNTLIKSGDFLTTSNEPGKAMIADKPGPTIGYAVENQKDGQAYVEILVQPGRFYYPTNNENLEIEGMEPSKKGNDQKMKTPGRQTFEGKLNTEK